MRKNSRTFVTLFYWTKLLGLNPFKLSIRNDLEYSYIGMTYGCLLSALYSYVCYVVIIERLKIVVPGDSPIGQIVDSIGIVSGFLESALTWMNFRFNQNRLRLIVESFSKAWSISVELGIPDDSEKSVTNLGLSLLIFNCTYSSMMIFNYWMSKDHHDGNMVLWTIYGIIRLSALNVMTIFLWSFVIVKHKFRQLNEKVRFVMRNTTDDEGSPRSTRDSSRRDVLISEKIVTISKLHRQLRDVIDRVQNRFGGIVVFDIISELTLLMFVVHIGYRFVKKLSSPITAQEISFVCVLLLWILFCGLVLALLSIVCGSLTDEANETGNILHERLIDRDNFGDTVAAAKIQLLSMELLQNRVKISLLGCLDLDQFFLYSTIGTATTYLTIMLQFYN